MEDRKKVKKDFQKLGVVIGRFQVAGLHAGHEALLDFVYNNNNLMLVLLGCRTGEFTDKDPLSFELRKKMILQKYPQAKVLAIFDTQKDEEWSKNVDAIIQENFSEYNVTLFGSRDSFIKSYYGQYKTEEMEFGLSHLSGTAYRQKIKDNPKDTEDFREGVVYANQVRFPVSYQTVDMAVLSPSGTKILLGRKSGKTKFQFFGGFVDPTDENLEASAKRELQEEAGNFKTSKFQYLGSSRITDTRYRGQRDQIMTAFFLTEYVSGEIKASDDIEEVAWFSITELSKVLADYHQKLLPLLMIALNQRNSKE